MYELGASQMNGNRRIKFYNAYDNAAGYRLVAIQAILDSDLTQLDYTDVNQIIELNNIKKFIDSSQFLADWSDSQIDKYKSICKSEIPKYVSIFYKQITDENVIEIYNRLIPEYHEDFWEAFDKFKLYNQISSDIFLEILNANNTQLIHILCQRKIVKAYGNIITNYLINHPKHAELIMKEHLERREEQKKLYFPDELTPEDKLRIISAYIELPDANANYVELVSKSGSTKELPIDDRLRLSARNIHKQWIDENINFDTAISFGTSVSFVDSDDVAEYSIKNHTAECRYGIKWIKENADCPTLLNNFIHLFGLVDEQFRCTLVSLQSKMSVFERYMGVKGKDEYNAGSEFMFGDIISSGQIFGYTQFLKSQGTQIEALFKWFFECYLSLEFGVTGFTYEAPSKASNIIEKCHTLAISMDSVLKQFRMYCKDGVINRELFEMSSEHVFFDRIPSMQSRKYIYARSENMKFEMHLCYSDQSLLTYNKKTKGKYNNVPQMLIYEEMSINDFEHFQKPHIEFLIERGLIQKNHSEILQINVNRAYILKELYNNEVVCYSYCSPSTNNLIDQLITSGDLEVGNTLFSKPEQNYLNYMLNKSVYSNGLDLRNRYLHGTNSLSKKDLTHDYIELFKITAVMVIKINEEFCLRFPLSEGDY